MGAPKNENVTIALLEQNIGFNGAVYRGSDPTKMPLETAPRPIDLDSSFVSRGLISEDGISKSFEVEETEIKEHNGNPVKVLASSKKATLSFEYLDFYNIENLKDLFGEENVTTTEIGDRVTINIYMTGETLPALPTVIKFKDGDKRMLLCAPQAQVSIADGFEMSFKADEAVKIPIKMTCLPYSITMPDGSKKETSIYYLTDKEKPDEEAKKVSTTAKTNKQDGNTTTNND